MKVSELKTVVNALQTFATVREKNEGVDTRFGIQAGAGRLKFISGDGTSGIIIDVQETEEKASFYTDFRPFAQGVKILPAKSDVTLSVSEKGLSITAAAGGQLLLKNKGMLRDAGFAKKPQSAGGFVVVSDAFRQMSKLFPAVTKGEEKLSSISGTIDNDPFTVTFVEPRVKTKYASWRGGPLLETEAWKPIDIDSAFFEALGIFEGNCVLNISNGVTAYDERRTVYSRSTASTDPLPILSVQGDLIGFHMERKRLIDLLKGQVPHDQYARVVMAWDKDELEIRPYGSEDGMTIPVQTAGNGTRGVNANLMIDMLQGMDDAKRVTVAIAQGSPAIILSAEEYSDWTLLVAPLIQ